MKRLLILLLLLMLTACSAAPAEKREPLAPEAAPTEKPTLPEEEPVPLPEPEEPSLQFSVETLRLQGEEYSEDATPLLTYDIRLPVLTVLREDGIAVVDTGELSQAEAQALEVAAAFNERFYDWTLEENYIKLAEMAGEDLAWFREEGLDWYGGYACELTCEVYQTEQMVSVSGLYYTYTGGAHPNTSWLSWNFDLTEGVFFGAELLATDAELQDAVAAEILRQAGTPREDGSVPADEYWEDYEALIADWANYAVSFDEAGMTVVFSPYELAPYAAGPQEVHVSYDWLKPHLNPQGRALLQLEEE